MKNKIVRIAQKHIVRTNTPGCHVDTLTRRIPDNPKEYFVKKIKLPKNIFEEKNQESSKKTIFAWLTL